MRGETSKLFWVSDVVHLGSGLPKSSVNMRGMDEFDRTVLESRRSENRKRVKSVKLQNRPAMDNTEPSRDATKNSVVTATDTSISLLLALFSIFLVTPTTVNRENGIWSA
jgi:hypothetical protein